MFLRYHLFYQRYFIWLQPHTISFHYVLLKLLHFYFLYTIASEQLRLRMATNGWMDSFNLFLRRAKNKEISRTIKQNNILRLMLFFTRKLSLRFSRFTEALFIIIIINLNHPPKKI